MLVSPERRHDADRPIGIDPDRAGLNFFRHAQRATYVTGPDACPQTVAAIVGDGYRLGFVLELDDGKHRPEDFFLGNAHIVLYISKYVGLDYIGRALFREKGFHPCKSGWSTDH